MRVWRAYWCLNLLKTQRSRPPPCLPLKSRLQSMLRSPPMSCPCQIRSAPYPKTHMPLPSKPLTRRLQNLQHPLGVRCQRSLLRLKRARARLSKNLIFQKNLFQATSIPRHKWGINLSCQQNPLICRRRLPHQCHLNRPHLGHSNRLWQASDLLTLYKAHIQAMSKSMSP